MVRTEFAVLSVVFLVSVVALMSFSIAPNANVVYEDEGAWAVPCATGWKTWDACKFRGICRGSYRLCDDGWWSKCLYPETYESKEVSCDGIDNNCDGVIDEGCST